MPENSILRYIGLVFVTLHLQGANEGTLHNFRTPPKGAFPLAVLARDSAGNLYGTASVGGPAGQGTIHKVSPAGVQRVLYSFTGGTDGGNPQSGVILDPAGNLYGTTYAGGSAGLGVVYKVDSSGRETVLYSFKGGSDGANPYAGVTRDSEGNLYGTTALGGAGFWGTVYKLDKAGNETVLYSFGHSLTLADGAGPYAGVILDTSGNLYGTTYSGGAIGCGEVYKLDTTGLETVLYSFACSIDGGAPNGGLVQDAAGNLYGTTEIGGASFVNGVVYKVDTSGNETVLYSFSGGADGSGPYSTLVLDTAGNLYGTTISGGTAQNGVVFKLDTSNRETVLYSFLGGTNGSQPEAGVTRDPAGNLYGTTFNGGSAGVGTVYEVSAAGQQTVLYSFPPSGDGVGQLSGLIRDSDGNLYGTTPHGGAVNAGTVYQISPSGKETVLHSFAGGTDGANPQSGVIRDSAGNLYGTTEYGGASGYGTVF